MNKEIAKIAVINCSPDVYNLGAKKIEKWHRDKGDVVISSTEISQWVRQCDKIYLSAIFTTDLSNLCQYAVELKSGGVEIEIGGPAPTAMPGYVKAKCGIEPHIGLDARFECIMGNFDMVFTSRGCPNRCGWCIVPRLEPERIEYDAFPTPTGENPRIGDNNILATSEKHQHLVVEKLKGIKNLDINSGFDPRLFTEGAYGLYSRLQLKCFRLAFDSMDEERDFQRAVSILKKHGVGYRDIIVYSLIGYPGTTYEDAIYRLEKTRSLGCSPYPQRFQPLNSIISRNYVAPGWDKEKLKTLRLYWINPRVWRSCSFEEFKRSMQLSNRAVNLL